MKKEGNHQKSAVGNKPLSISTLNLFISYLTTILVSLKTISPSTHIHPALKPNSALHHCLLVFLFLGDQIFYRSYVDRQHFHLRSFASLCSTVVKKRDFKFVPSLITGASQCTQLPHIPVTAFCDTPVYFSLQAIKVSDTLEHPRLPIPYACAQPYLPGSGSAKKKAAHCYATHYLSQNRQ